VTKPSLPGQNSPLARPIEHVSINGKKIGNRYAVQRWKAGNCTTSGGITDEVVRRWQRFGESGAKLIFGGEAMAVRPDGRANPNQLMISEGTKAGLGKLREALLAAHKRRYCQIDDVVIGFQLTHSGRFCKPNDKFGWNRAWLIGTRYLTKSSRDERRSDLDRRRN